MRRETRPGKYLLPADAVVTTRGLPEPDYFLGVGSGSHGVRAGRALERIEAVLEAERPNLVIVAGDVNSTLARSTLPETR